MKILLLLIAVFFSIEVVAQPGYTNIDSRYNWGGAIFKRLHVPAGGYPVSLPGTWNGDGELRFDSVHRRLYYKHNGVFYGLADTTDLGIDRVLALNQALTANRNIDFTGREFSITGLQVGITLDGAGQDVTIQAADRLILDVENLILPNLDDNFNDTTEAKLLVRRESDGKVYRTFWPAGGVGGGLNSVTIGNADPIFATGGSGTPSDPIFAFNLQTQTANRVFAGPTTGSAAAPTFRALVAADIPKWVPLVVSTTSSATPTINTDVTDVFKLTAQAVNITSFTTNLSGAHVDGAILEIQITGTATRTITWGTEFVSTTVALPTTTNGTTTLFIILQKATTSYGTNKWHCTNTY